MFQRATLTAGLILVSGLLLNGCGSGDEDSIAKRKMIIIANHYPSTPECGGTLLAATVNGLIPQLDDTISQAYDKNVTCEDFGRKEGNNTIEKSCFIKDFGADTNVTCAIGVNYSDYAGDIVDLITDKLAQ